jgi:hypothetical protein
VESEGAFGYLGEGREKNFTNSCLLLNLWILGGSDFCFKFRVKRGSCIKEGAGWVERMRAGGGV